MVFSTKEWQVAAVLNHAKDDPGHVHALCASCPRP